jgi:secreted Zn-dependent insulinase-like peptidase
MDTLRDQLDAIQKLTFTRFLEMKKAFLKRVRLVWLIEGHLLANQAMEMVEITEQALG